MGPTAWAVIQGEGQALDRDRDRDSEVPKYGRAQKSAKHTEEKHTTT